MRLLFDGADKHLVKQEETTLVGLMDQLLEDVIRFIALTLLASRQQVLDCLQLKLLGLLRAFGGFEINRPARVKKRFIGLDVVVTFLRRARIGARLSQVFVGQLQFGLLVLNLLSSQ